MEAGFLVEQIDDLLADTTDCPFMDRHHRIHPGLALRGRHDMVVDLAGLLDRLQRIDVFLLRNLVGEIGRFLHRLFDLRLDIAGQAGPELRIDDHSVLKMRMIGRGDVRLNFEEFLGVDI